MPYAAVLFDLDGTLVDNADVIQEATVQSYASIGARMTADEFPQLRATFQTTEEILKHLGISPTLAEQVRSERHRIYLQLLPGRARWIDGAQETLQACNHLPRGLVTLMHGEHFEVIDRELSLRRHLRSIVTADRVTHGKPDPEGLLLAAKELEVEPTDCIFVGDGIMDIEAADRAGMQCCYITGNEADHDAIREVFGPYPTFLVRSIREAATLLFKQ